MTTQSRSDTPADLVTWWRASHQRDLESFARTHGRPPDSLNELSNWLKPPPIRSERPQR